MGARKQKKTLNLDWATKEVSATSNSSVPARNLRKTDLGAVIFGCTHSTIDECFSSHLFGLPEGHYSYIKNISQGLVLFLFNYSDRKLHGIYEAASPGQMNINQYAWGADAGHAGYTRYPAQVRIRVIELCQPLSENEFRPVIANNYYETKLFYFELDHDQKQKLISLFKPMITNPYTSLSVTPKRQEYNASQNMQAEEGFEPASPPPGYEPRTIQTLPGNLNPTSKRSYASVVGRTTTSSSSGPTGSLRGLFKTESDFQTTNDDRQMIQASNVSLSASDLNEDTDDCLQVKEESQPITNTWEDDLSHLRLIEENEDEVDFLHANPWEENEAQGEQLQTSDLSGQHLDEPSSSSQPLMNTPDCDLPSSSVPDTAAETSTTNAVAETSTDLQPLVVKLMHEVELMKASQVKQMETINMFEEKLVESKVVIQHLENRLSGLESVVKPAEISRHQPMFIGSVYIVGGFDGSSWLSTLESYYPSYDINLSRSPMNFVKRYPSAATLYGEIYHFVGGESHKVESFNPINNQWILRPPLYWKNTHVAAASIKDRIYVVGGLNGRQCSSGVEYLDLNMGMWLPTLSMQSKRMAPAAAEINNVLYVAGGCNAGGCNEVSYLSSVERFDPREEVWHRLPNMKVMKGGHSMVVLNEKLYTLGGYNGRNFIPTVECFDTRMDVWFEAQSMNVPRGNFGAFVLGEEIYAIGGTMDDGAVLDTVECYKEGSRWEVAANMKAIGKRSYFSGIVL